MFNQLKVHWQVPQVISFKHKIQLERYSNSLNFGDYMIDSWDLGISNNLRPLKHNQVGRLHNHANI